MHSHSSCKPSKAFPNRYPEAQLFVHTKPITTDDLQWLQAHGIVHPERTIIVPYNKEDDFFLQMGTSLPALTRIRMQTMICFPVDPVAILIDNDDPEFWGKGSPDCLWFFDKNENGDCFLRELFGGHDEPYASIPELVEFYSYCKRTVCEMSVRGPKDLRLSLALYKKLSKQYLKYHAKQPKEI